MRKENIYVIYSGVGTAIGAGIGVALTGILGCYSIGLFAIIGSLIGTIVGIKTKK